jgi:hypothetical protein
MLRSQGGGGSGTIGGSIASTQVAYGSGANTITGSANLGISTAGSVGGGWTFQTGSGSGTDQGFIFGSYAAGFSGIWTTGVTPTGNNYLIGSNGSSGLRLNSSTAIDFRVANSSIAQISSTALVPSSAGVLDLGGSTAGIKRLYVDYTNTGTVGAVTINKAAGRVNIAAAGTSVVVTNSLVTAASKVFCTISTNDATAVLKNVVPASGSFTITLNAATTAQTSIDFFVVNAD